jgi:hypothetical protein
MVANRSEVLGKDEALCLAREGLAVSREIGAAVLEEEGCAVIERLQALR